MALVKEGMPIWFRFGAEEDKLETGIVKEIVWRKKRIYSKKYNSLKPGQKRKYKKSKSGIYYRSLPFTLVELFDTKEKFAIPYWLFSAYQTGLLYEGSKCELMSEKEFRIILKKEAG